MTEHRFTGDSLHRGSVARVGDTVRRPRSESSKVVEALLRHLHTVGFDGAPRFVGIDDQGLQVLDYIDGIADAAPPWQDNDEANAAQLGRLATLLRELHLATADFAPPDGAPSTHRARSISGHDSIGPPSHPTKHVVRRPSDIAALLVGPAPVPNRHDWERGDARNRARGVQRSASRRAGVRWRMTSNVETHPGTDVQSTWPDRRFAVI